MLIVYALGLLSKPMLVTLPFALLLLDFWPLRRVRVLEGQSSGVGLRLLLLEKLPLLVLAAAATGMAIWSQGSSGAMGTLDQYPLWTRLVNAPLAVGMYLWTTTVPVNLAVIYPHPAEGVPLAKAAVSATVVLAISLAALFGWRRYPFVFAGWFWFLGTLVPVIGLVQVGSTSRADRYTYLPQIGLLIAAVWLAAALVERRPAARRAAAVAAAAIVLTLAGLCVRQVSFWRNPITLFSHTVEVSPLSSSAWFNLGVGYALNKQPNLAEPCFRRAAELNPLGLGIMQNWAASLIELERPEEAADVLKKLIDMDPNKPEHHYQLGLAYFRLEDYREAIFRAEEALRIDPEYLLALKLIAQSEQALGNEQPQE
jgi:Tfp pilus assembly protein PilF